MTIAAIISIISAIIGLVTYVLKRKQSPSREERLDDMRESYGATLENIRRLRGLGQDADADAMLEQLVNRMRDETKADHHRDAERERVGNKASTWNNDKPNESQSTSSDGERDIWRGYDR